MKPALSESTRREARQRLMCSATKLWSKIYGSNSAGAKVMQMMSKM